MSIPAPVKVLSEKTRMTFTRKMERAMRMKARERLFVHVLGGKPRDGECGKISLAHFHPLVISAIGYVKGQEFPWKAEVPVDVVRTVASEGFAYDAANRVERLIAGSPPLQHKPFVPVPNVPLSHDMQEQWGQEADLRRLNSMAPCIYSPVPSPSPSTLRATREEREWAESMSGHVDRLISFKRENERENAALRAKLESLEKEVAGLRQGVSNVPGVSGRSPGRIHYEGLCRYNLCSPDWHSANPGAAKELFGFHTWEETQYHIWAFWPNLRAPDRTVGRSYDPASKLTPFEMCLVTKMRIHRSFTYESLAVMWEKTKSAISKHIRKWAPQWGEVGEMMSILHVSPEYLRHSLPRNFRGSGLEKVMGLADGKDYLCETDRSHSAVSRAMQSNKMHASAFRCITWSTPSGLTFEHTDLFFARVHHVEYALRTYF